MEASLKTKKRRAASDPVASSTAEKVDFDVYQGEVADEVLLDLNLNEPTMGEKLASVYLLDDNKSKSNKEQESYPQSRPPAPSADSIYVLLKQALHADDCTLLLECLYTQDEKVITKSISQLQPSNVLKLLSYLVSIMESRGAILACALPWLKCLLLQHASGIMSHESSLQALNSLYQLIDSRISTFKSAIQVSGCLDILYAGATEEEEVDLDQIKPAIYEDRDESEEESEEADQDSKDALSDEADGCISDDMMSE